MWLSNRIKYTKESFLTKYKKALAKCTDYEQKIINYEVKHLTKIVNDELYDVVKSSEKYGVKHTPISISVANYRKKAAVEKVVQQLTDAGFDCKLEKTVYGEKLFIKIPEIT